MVTVIDLTDDGDTPPSSSSSAGQKRFKRAEDGRSIRPPPVPLRAIPAKKRIDVASLKRAAEEEEDSAGEKKNARVAEVRRDLKRVTAEVVRGEEAEVPKKRIKDGRKYILGIDPGTVNCAWSWLDTELEKVRMQLWDFSTWDGYSHDMKEGYGDRLVAVLKKMQPMFDQTMLVVMEKQEVKGRNPAVDKVHLELAQAIRTMYPHVTFRFIRMQNVRKFWGTSGTDYEERKNNSLFTDVMSDIDHIRVHSIFKKVGGKGTSEDPIEASQMAVYAYHNLEKLMTALPFPEKKKCPYELIQMDAYIVNMKEKKRATILDYRNGKMRLAAKRLHPEQDPEFIEWLGPPQAKKRKIVAPKPPEGELDDDEEKEAKKKKKQAKSAFFKKSRFFRKA